MVGWMTENGNVMLSVKCQKGRLKHSLKQGNGMTDRELLELAAEIGGKHNVTMDKN
jgi:hypothetical protein